MEALEWPGQKKYNKAKMQDLGLDTNDNTKIGSYKTSGNFTFIRIAKAGHMVKSILHIIETTILIAISRYLSISRSQV